MPNIQAEQTINAPIARVYEISQDYSVRYEWDPFPDYLRNLDGGNGMPFVGREVEGRAKSGVFMRVRFVRVKAPEVAAITMVKGRYFWRNLPVRGGFAPFPTIKLWRVSVIPCLRPRGARGCLIH
nr:hypothetical protein LVJ77_01590 [Conchiformibius kuhniae]